jgi:hypothetical protein
MRSACIPNTIDKRPEFKFDRAKASGSDAPFDSPIAVEDDSKVGKLVGRLEAYPTNQLVGKLEAYPT